MLSFKYSYVAAFFNFLYRVLTRRRVIGLEHVPTDGAVIIVANHLALADPPLLAVSLGRRVQFMAKHQLFRIPVVGWALRRLGAHPVRRGRLDMTAMRWVHQTLGEGAAVVIFPEGQRSRSGKLRTGYRGVASIAARAKVPVLPVGIAGTEKLERGLFWLRPRVTVNVGEPFMLSRNGHKPGREELAALTDEMMRAIARQLPPEYRGKYS